MPNFSIIILFHRNQKDLWITLDSILNQNYGSCEVIILDRKGFIGSDVQLEKYRHEFKSRLRMIVCDDAGVTESMNTGVRIARGKYITFIESGNELEENSLEQALKSVNKYPQADATYGVYGPWEKKASGRELVNAKAETLPIKNTQFINLYYKKELHQKFGFYNSQENVAINYAFCLKAFYLGGAIVRPFDIKISNKNLIST